MMQKFQKLLEEKAKKGKKMSDSEKQAKMDAVKEIESMASGMMADKLGGLKKVTVASPDQEGLKKGLKVAENLVEGKMPEESEEEMSEESEEAPEQMEKEASEEDMEDSEEMPEESEEDPEAKIKRLEEELMRLKKSQE